MGTGFIEITQSLGSQFDTDAVFVPDILRIMHIGGESSAQNALFYAFANSRSADITTLSFKVAFINWNAQSVGDYIDVPLPDRTFYPRLYVVLVLINDAWASRVFASQQYTLLSPPAFYCTDSSQSTEDVSQSHSIHMSGYNSVMGCFTHVCVAFEDWPVATTDMDYNDVIVALSSAALDDTITNNDSFS
jgi:hypothetical protein